MTGRPLVKARRLPDGIHITSLTFAAVVLAPLRNTKV